MDKGPHPSLRGARAPGILLVPPHPINPPLPPSRHFHRSESHNGTHKNPIFRRGGRQRSDLSSFPLPPSPFLPSIRYLALGNRPSRSRSESVPGAVMTKQNVVPAEAVAAITAAAAVASSSPLYPYPPPRSFQKKYLSQLDFAGGRIGTWVESMKASSPTHTKAVGAIGAPVDEQYAAWIVSAVPHRFVSWLQSAGC